MTKGSVNSIETFGLVDGPGIRTVVFLNGCKLRCIYCHNPEMWHRLNDNYEPEELVKKIIRYKSYFGKTGGVTFSGGEPLLQPDFLIETLKLLKENDINTALDTAGVGVGRYDEILKYVDLVILDIKHAEKEGYKKITGQEITESEKFIEALNKNNKKVWIRQVVVPTIMDNMDYLVKLKKYLKKINNIEKIEFLPYHKLGFEKYETLGIDYPCKNINEMDKDKCQELYETFINLND